MSLTGRISLSVTATLSNTRDLGSASVTEALSATINLTNGAGANQATQAWGDTRTLTSGANEALDLSGTLTNGLGATVSFTRIVGLIVQADSDNGSTITVGGAASNAFSAIFGDSSDEFVVRPGGTVAFFAPDATGYVVSGSSPASDQLKILNDDGAASASYTIWLVGSEA